MRNQEILDDDQIDSGKKVIDKRTKNLVQRTFIYLTIMILIQSGLVYLQYKDFLSIQDISFCGSVVIAKISGFIIVGFIIELIRFAVRKFKNKQVDVITLIDPFWFQTIESAFSIWILLKVSKAILIAVPYILT